MTHYGKKRRTNKEKRVAALQFVVMSTRSQTEKIATLVSSYGFTEADALEFVREHSI